MQLLFYALFALGIVGLDQITKYVTVEKIALFAEVPFIDGLLHFTYVQNFGAAWSMMQGMRWAFVALFLALTALLLWEQCKHPLPFRKFERWCIAAIWAGGLGNVIDRVFRGYVVDMIEVEFIRFPVFNVADCFITCGCIALAVSLIFFNKGFWKEEKK